MRVTFCAHDRPGYVNGPNAGLQRLVPELRKHGVQSQILCMNWEQEMTPMVEYLKDQGCDVATTLLPAYTHELIRWILTRLQESPPDIFVPNLAVPGFYAARWVRTAGIPTVGALRSDDAFHRGLQQEFVFGQRAYRLSGLVCVSEFLKMQILRQHPRDTAVKRIPTGVPLPNSMTQRPEGRIRIVYVGRLVEQAKRISDVTKALCRVVREIPHTEVVMYGEGYARPAVEQIIQKHGRNLPIHLFGQIEPAHVQQHLLRSHILVLLSDYEGLPVAVMEAMACGVVPVCLRTRSGIPELIQDGVTGLLVNDRDDDFLKAIRRVCSDTDLWERLSRSARKKIEDGYTNTLCAGRWADFFHELHAKAPVRRPIEQPRTLNLPFINPGLASQDIRPASLFNTLGTFAGRLKYKILSQGRY